MKVLACCLGKIRGHFDLGLVKDERNGRGSDEKWDVWENVAQRRSAYSQNSSKVFLKYWFNSHVKIIKLSNYIEFST